ncbi:MAG: pirin family protein [Candidatus Latescibacterota bacterium]
MNLIETNRGIRMILKSRPVTEGAGVHLKRAFGFREAPAFDPFLMLDDFRSNDPRDYRAGFPWHPHRGIETVTYILEGSIEHEDSIGNKGVIRAGGVQWMTAGSGIIHQETPKGDETGRMGGLQLWANLPTAQKMMDPRYQEIQTSQIPEVSLKNGVKIRVISGEVAGTHGPVRDIVTNPEFLDITIPPQTEFVHPTKSGHTVFSYILEGEARFCRDYVHFDREKNPRASREHLILFDDGAQIVASTEDEPVRFLLVSGKPIGEPVAWQGSVVMNTREELATAFEELRTGKFIKHGSAG